MRILRAARAAFVLAAIVLGLAACYPVFQPMRPTPEPLIPTLPAPAGLPPLLAPAASATFAIAAAPSPVTPPPQPASPSPSPSATPLLQSPPSSPTLTLTVSTVTPAASPSGAPVPGASASATATPSRAPVPSGASGTPQKSAEPATAWGLPASARGRVGVGATVFGSIDYAWGTAAPGWWLNWSTVARPPLRPEIPFARMVFPRGERISPSLAEIKAAAAANPGSLWLIGNEPDVAWQGDSTPEQYAAVYHDVYAALKQADGTARVVIGGISQPTPLRLAYLDRVLAAYKARYGTDMPVDIWNVHAFILREEPNSWGVGIPPGMEGAQGKLYEIGDHADLTIFKQQIVDFRRWMAERGQRDKPLIVSEYGILMPPDYGFPPDAVKQFMTATFDYFLTAKDAALGYAADENRLVQAFCWYSTSDTVYPTSNLFDPATKAITPLGEAFKQYVMSLP